MGKEQRSKELLLDVLIYVLNNAPVTKENLIDHFSKENDVSERTVRRYLEVIEKKHLIKTNKEKYHELGVIDLDLSVWKHVLKKLINRII
ncbi:MAG: hypothetical protein AB7G87_13935 [Clostridia bacterium]